MNKNKKRLSRLLIPMLAISGTNVNAMENTKMSRNKSVGKNQSKTSLKELDKLGEQRKRILVENIELTRRKKQGVIQYQGPALDELYKAGYKRMFEKNQPLINKYGLRIHRPEYAGHSGSVTLYEKNDKLYAVKYVPNYETTGIETENNIFAHKNDNKNEKRFYEDTKTILKDYPWIIRLYDEFTDQYGTYFVIDFVNGITLKNWFKNLSKNQNLNLAEKCKKIANILTKYNQILNDLEKVKRVNYDLHAQNVMVVNDPKNESEEYLKVIDNGSYLEILDDKLRLTEELYISSQSPEEAKKSHLDNLFMIFNDAIIELFGSKTIYAMKYSYNRLHTYQHLTNDDIDQNKEQSEDAKNGYIFLQLSKITQTLGQTTLDPNGNNILSDNEIKNYGLERSRSMAMKLINELPEKINK